MPAPTRVTLVPHTHWDREWYEPFSVFSERLVAMMDTLLELAADGFPHFHLDGQTAMIDDYLERRPERERDLGGAVSAGRLSAGPWVTQMDEFLTSGESHIRNLEMGLERARTLGRALEVGYMPDQFGHIGQMPQLLRLGGIERAMVWRGVPAAIRTSTFRWRAPDGSEVLTESMPLGYSSGWSLMQAKEPEVLADTLRGEIDRLRPFAPQDRIVVMVGYDHAGPDATLPERLAAAPLGEDVDVAISSLASHVEALETTEDLPVWTGELRSGARAHLLPNVSSARVHQKRERGRLEALLERYAEPLAALVQEVEWPEDELRRAWTLMLWNGAHDSVCGCSHDQVALDVDARHAEVRAIGEAIVDRAMTSLAERISRTGVLRFNPSPFEREGVPALGYAMVEPTVQPVPAGVAIDAVGDGVRADGIAITFADEPDIGDLYTFCPAAPDRRPTPPSSVAVDGDLVDASWDGLTIRVRISRRDGEPFLRLDGVIRNERKDHRVRLHVELDRAVERALVGAPFELVDRPLLGEGGEGESPSPTWPARHVALAGTTAVLHEGVFEYEVVEDRSLAVTLLRCVGTISREHLATRPWPAGPQTPTPGGQMLGETSFSLAIVPRGDAGGVLRAWERFALPLVDVATPGEGTGPDRGSLLPIGIGSAELSNVRRREGRLEVRVWNRGTDGATAVTIDGGISELRPAEIATIGVPGR